jgi:RND family efflux transporter MFP subunit
MRIADWRLVVVLLTLVAACGRRKAEGLPPATGAGAAPLPNLPQVEASNEGTTVAPTEGQTTGTTYPRAESQIGPNAGGVLDKIFVKEGDPVKRGMVLFRQDSRDAALRVSQAKAALASADVNLKATQTEYDRTKTMYDQKAVNQMQWDQLVARLDGAKVGVEQAKVMLEMAQKMLADTTVRSPLDGVVTSKLKNEGEMATMMPPTVVLVVQDQSTLELRFRLPEKAIGDVKTGDTVTAAFESTGEKRQVKVIRVNPAVDPRSRTVEAVATIPNQDRALKSGLLATVTLPHQATAAPPPGGATR